ncbi:MAG: HlyC/CorC family transporter [Rhodocyclales bacterium]|nr:HlyC/CorC family transporter [Rhodocyclales bacterium]
MDEVPLSVQFVVLGFLLVISGFFSLAETAMMAANRYRLRHLAAKGSRAAKLALDLLGKTDQMLGVVLLGNNLINAASATLVSVIAIELFGEEKWALGAGTLLVTFAILVVSEITPKIIGAAYADRVVRVVPFFLWPMLRAAYPVVWFVNLFAQGLLRALRLKPGSTSDTPSLTQEELRTVVLESSHPIPSQHRAILINLFDLEHITVDDVMTPRGEIEAIDVNCSIGEIRDQLATSFHTRLPVFEDEPGNVIGILYQRRLMSSVLGGEFSHDILRRELAEPYFVPAGTGIFAQLQFFRDNRQRIGLVVDEYGELLGLVTLEDIVEEIVGKFTTSMPGSSTESSWDEGDAAIVDGSHSLREINRTLGLSLPVDGPKTLNGLIIEHLQDIPEVGVGLRIAGVAMEILQTENKRIKTVKLYRPPVPK